MSNVIEIWKPIVGWEGLYECSNLGRIKSYRQNEEGVIKNPTPYKNGYLRVNLCKDGKYKTMLVHRIVCAAFLENKDGLKYVDHINGERTDNRLSNLRYVDKSSNQLNPITRQRMSTSRTGIKVDRNPVKIQLDINGCLIKVWDTAREASEALGISRQVIGDCCAGRCKSAGQYKWVNYTKEAYLIALLNKNIKKGAA